MSTPETAAVCAECGRDNRNGTHDALERHGHLTHSFTVPEVRVWPNGSTVTPQDARDAGWSWSEVCLNTEPRTSPIRPGNSDGSAS